MLSIENPSDPSCSSKLPALKTDERESEKLALQEADPGDLCERPTPNFSIRDYVFTSRSKDIGTNWPFPQQLLQLCLKHGISDLLPPFEPPDLVRAQCLSKKVEPSQPVARSESDLPDTKDAGPSDVGTESVRSHSCSLLDDLVVERSDQTQYTSPDKGKSIVDQGVALDEHIHRDAEISLAVRSRNQIERISCQIGELPCSASVNKSFSDASTELEVAGPAPLSQKLESSREPLEKKCRLIVKLGAISESNRAEDIVSNASTVSDPMASKICPVCKTFSSTSNTTLNAHMDQCLSVESNAQQVLTNFSTPKVKPRKKRLMVDIYKTAPRCTLEDLDRRNGTNWASELAFITLTNEGCTGTKRPKLLPLDARDDGDGAVYVDSNGIKLRILSKLNDTPAVISGEETKLRNHAKDIKASKTILISKQKRFTSKCSKIMKVKAHHKKLSSFKLLKARIKPAPGGDFHADTYQDKEESNISNACDQVNSSGSATLRQWVCSKRSDLPKKLNNKDSHKTLENPVAITKDTLAENGQPDSRNTSGVRNILKFSRPSEDSTDPKTKKVNFLSNLVPSMEDGKKKSPKQPVSNFRWSSENTSSTCGHLIKLSRSSASLVSSPRSKKEEIHMGSLLKSDTSSDMTTKRSKNCRTLVKDQACSTLEKNVLVRTPSCSLESSKGNLNEKPSKKFRKNRSILRTGKREVCSLVKGLHDSIKDLSPDNTRASETPRTHQSGSLERECVSRSPIGKIMEQVSPSAIGISEPMHEGAAPNAMEDLHLEAECHYSRNETREMQVKVSSSFSGDHVTDPCIEKATGDPVTSETTISEKLTRTSNARLDPRPSVEGHVLSLSSGEAHVSRVMQKSLHKQEIHCDVVLHDQDVSQENQIADEAGVQGLKDYCTSQQTECQADTASIQESSACLTSHGDVGLEVHQENSSATSIRVTSNQPAQSPDSTASTVSLPSPKGANNRDSEAELLLRYTPAQDKFGSAVPSIENSVGTERRIVERIDRKSKVILLENKAEQSPKDQSFCCSCRESLSKESQFMRHSVAAGITTPSKGNMISSLHIGPRMSSSFHLYQSPKTNAMANSSLESPTQSNSTKVSSDSAINYPTCSDLGSPSPSSQRQTQSNTIPKLRLMGKDLMVVNKEEPVQPQAAASDYLTNARCLSPLRFASTSLMASHESFQYHRQLPGGSSALGRPPSTGSHQMPQYPPGLQIGVFAGGPPMQNGLMDHHSQQKKSYKNTVSPAACSLGRTVSSNQQHQKSPSSAQASYYTKEIIVIDPEPEADLRGSLVSPAGALPPVISGPDPLLQGQFTYFPQPNQLILRDVSGGPRPSFPNLYPSVNADFMKRAYLSEGPGPLIPSPFVFQSPTAGQLSPLYHSQTHR